MKVSKKFDNDYFNEIDLEKYGSILSVNFSPYEWSQDVLLIVFKNKIVVAQVNFNRILKGVCEKGGETIKEIKILVNKKESLDFDVIAEFEHTDTCTSICLSPETMINSLPINIQFCTGGIETILLRVVKGNLTDQNNCKVLAGHKNYVNDICYDFENNYIASTSDDCTARIWAIDSNYKCVTTFELTSPGMSVCWHREDNAKLLVAEKIGLIRFYNINTQRQIISFHYGKSLSSVHWAPNDPQMVGSLNLGELVLWDVTKPSFPKNLLIYTQNGGNLKFSPQGELVATINNLEGTLMVLLISNFQLRLSAKITLPTNLSWHFRLPILCVGDDRKLCFWKVMSK